MTTWLAAAETRASTATTMRAGPQTHRAEVQQARWFHAYHADDTLTVCGRPLDGLTPTGEEFLPKRPHCPRCDALTA